MIKPAILYKDELYKQMANTWFDPAYMYYYDTTPGLPDIPDKPDNQYQFVSIGSKGQVLGYFSYWVYEPSKRAMNFGLISFDKGNAIFMRDAIQMFKDMFEKFGVQSAEWRCYANNKEALSLYRRIIKDYGGREVGTLRRNGAPQNRELCDTVIFEILDTDLNWYEFKIYTNKEYEAIMEKEHRKSRLVNASIINNALTINIPELPELKINQVEPGWNPFE